MGVELLAFLGIVCLLASIISAMFGLAGGLIILTALTFFLDLATAIALHAAIQLVGNGSRILLSLPMVRWGVAGWFSLLTLPAAYLGGLCFQYANPEILELCIGFFIIGTIFLPKKSTQVPESGWWFVFLGALSSFLGMLVAATGPLVASFFNLNNLKKEALVATKALCQGITQAAKMIVLGASIGFDYQPFMYPLLALGGAVIIGSWIGNRLLKYVPDASYDRWNNWLLAGIALLMIAKILYKWFYIL